MLDYKAFRADCERLGAAGNWKLTVMPPTDMGRLVLHRPAQAMGAPSFYLSAGIHGDEPAGPLALLRLLEEDRWPDANIWLAPCLNPDGFSENVRENAQGIDLNRDFRSPISREVAGQIEWLNELPQFDLTLLLHEDWEASGFYCYELNPDIQPSLAPGMVSAVREVCPIEEAAEIDGRVVSCPGIIRPDGNIEERTLWPEALWLAVHRTRLNYTLEAPSDWPMHVRVGALHRAVCSALHQFVGARGQPRAVSRKI